MSRPEGFISGVNFCLHCDEELVTAHTLLMNNTSLTCGHISCEDCALKAVEHGRCRACSMVVGSFNNDPVAQAAIEWIRRARVAETELRDSASEQAILQIQLEDAKESLEDANHYISNLKTKLRASDAQLVQAKETAKNSQKLMEAMECVICMDHNRGSYVNIPCGHMTHCFYCVPKTSNIPVSCPLCKTSVIIYKVFQPGESKS